MALQISNTAFMLIVLATSLLLLMPSSSSAKVMPQLGFANAEQLMNDNSSPMGAGVEGEVMDKVEARLLGALELLQSYKEVPIVPKFTEKRKNKFEFIRFGKRRR
uniref:FMRFamide-related peptide n=1 Tax=Heterodera glycines TaxID=51029 RepID=Q86G59_HETGL|nr:FMRFamide-related peptide precursor [Heterodera glycines]